MISTEKIQIGLKALEDCRLCPRDCGVNRIENRWAACKTGRFAVVDCHFAHFGEEHCIRGWNGSGTIFFSHCNLRCVFCQNYDISQAVAPGPAGKVSAIEFVEINRRTLSSEFEQAKRIAWSLGFHRLDDGR